MSEPFVVLPDDLVSAAIPPFGCTVRYTCGRCRERVEVALSRCFKAVKVEDCHISRKSGQCRGALRV
jgi:hypothetical protein